MTRNSASQGLAVANHLPQEVIARIIEATKDRQNAFYNSSHYDQKQLARYARVCKSWLAPARGALHKHIHVETAGQAFLLGLTLRDFDPELRKSITAFDMNTLFNDSNAQCIAHMRLLDMLPNIDELGIQKKHSQSLQKASCWASLQHIVFYTSYWDSTTHHHWTCLSATLSSLSWILDDSTWAIGQWASVSLPTVTMFTFQITDLPYLGVDELAALQLLPKMPCLRNLKIDTGQLSYDHEDILTPFTQKMVLEVATCLEHLAIMESEEHGAALNAELLGNLPNLRSLTYNGHLIDISYEDIRGLFPVSLEEIHLRWFAANKFALNMLNALSDRTFLPNLKFCPRLTLGYSRSGRSKDVDTIQYLLDEAVDASRSLKRRTELYYHNEACLITDSSDLPLLPFPSAYPSFIDRAVPAQVMQSLLSDTTLFPPSLEAPKKLKESVPNLSADECRIQ